MLEKDSVNEKESQLVAVGTLFVCFLFRFAAAKLRTFSETRKLFPIYLP